MDLVYSPPPNSRCYPLDKVLVGAFVFHCVDHEAKPSPVFPSVQIANEWPNILYTIEDSKWSLCPGVADMWSHFYWRRNGSRSATNSPSVVYNAVFLKSIEHTKPTLNVLKFQKRVSNPAMIDCLVHRKRLVSTEASLSPSLPTALTLETLLRC